MEAPRPAGPLSGRIFRSLAGVLLTALLVIAPLNFGSTRPGGSELIAGVCALATILWIASLVCGGERPRIPLGAAACAAVFTVAALPWIGGWPTPTPVDPFTLTHFSHVAARWPYGVLARTPTNALRLTLALTAVIFPLIDLARIRGWALAFSAALVGTAVLVSALALLQNYTHATGIYWRHDGKMVGNFSGTFYHHTSAGAYFNTAWPLAVAFAFLAGLPPLSAGLAGLAAVVIIAGHGSHVSRFPQVAAVLVAPFLLASVRIRSLRRWFLLGAAIIAVVLLIIIGGRTDVISARWHLMLAAAPAAQAPANPPESAWPALIRDDLFIPSTSHPGLLGDRGESWRAALRSIEERPWFGHGPANWMGAASQNTTDPFVRTFFQFLQFTHQDLLQFAVEWGIPAALAWWGLLVGGIVAVIRRRKTMQSFYRALGIASACALGAVLLQSQLDFPLQIPAVALNAVVLAALCWAASGTVQPGPPELLPT